MKKLTRADKIRRHIRDNPTQPLREVAEKFNTTYQIVYMTKRTMAKTPKAEANTITITTVDTPAQIEMFEPKPDPVNHPPHYKTGGIETIDFIEAKGLNYNLGNVVKYITRADHKGNRKQDLEKAVWYLNREISKAA
jgi:hypothetical protein